MELTYSEYLARNSYQKFTSDQLQALLFNYSYTCDIKSAEMVIADAVNLNFQDENGNTALLLAIQVACIEVVKLLISSGININLRNNNDDTALSLVLKKCYDEDGEERHWEIADILIEHCGGKGFNDLNGFEALIYATKSGNKELVTKLIDAGMYLDFQKDNGRTALIEAVIDKHNEIAIELIHAGANTDIQSDNSYQFSAICWSAGVGQEDVIDALIHAGANLDLEIRLGPIFHPALLEAIGRENIDIALKLIDAGANPNCYAYSSMEYDDHGNYAKLYTPLMLASQNGNILVVQKLLEIDEINIDFQNSVGETALMWAVSNDQEKIAQELILAGADISLITRGGETILDILNKSKKVSL